jgi:hypothetical protein
LEEGIKKKQENHIMGKQINFFAAEDDRAGIFEALVSVFGNLHVALKRGDMNDVAPRSLILQEFVDLFRHDEEWIIGRKENISNPKAVTLGNGKVIYVIDNKPETICYTPSHVREDNMAVIGRFYMAMSNAETKSKFDAFVRKLKKQSIKLNDGMTFLIFPSVAKVPMLEFWGGVKSANPLVREEVAPADGASALIGFEV